MGAKIFEWRFPRKRNGFNFKNNKVIPADYQTV